ncbi:transcriptional regulator [bacterium]|nr:transcriptional regulator [bacterium]MBU1995189.1 transcriptional regulator [bacterium]
MFDTLLHQPVRSKLISLLISNEELPFGALKKMLDLSDGNLSSHLKKLEEQEYIHIEKFFEAKRPKTVVSITKKGREAFKNYINELKKFIEEN